MLDENDPDAGAVVDPVDAAESAGLRQEFCL
jgi:hypothetical protein